MKVSDLQRLLEQLGTLLETAGAKVATVSELKTVREAMTPLSQLSLKEFATFLVKAQAAPDGEAASRSPRSSRGGSATKPSGGGAIDLNSTIQEVCRLYDRAADPATTEELIAEKTAPLKQLSKDNLVMVAEAIELMGMRAKKKDEIATAIRQRILARKGATQRAGLIDRPATTPGGGNAETTRQTFPLQDGTPVAPGG